MGLSKLGMVIAGFGLVALVVVNVVMYSAALQDATLYPMCVLITACSVIIVVSGIILIGIELRKPPGKK